jgi:hypothetical protein
MCGFLAVFGLCSKFRMVRIFIALLTSGGSPSFDICARILVQPYISGLIAKFLFYCLLIVLCILIISFLSLGPAIHRTVDE